MARSTKYKRAYDKIIEAYQILSDARVDIQDKKDHFVVPFDERRELRLEDQALRRIANQLADSVKHLNAVAMQSDKLPSQLR